jgi:hypothetical protein
LVDKCYNSCKNKKYNKFETVNFYIENELLPSIDQIFDKDLKRFNIRVIGVEEKFKTLMNAKFNIKIKVK